MAAEFIAHSLERADLRSPLRYILSHVRRHPQFAVLMVFGAFTNAALASIVPILAGRGFDHILAGGATDYIAWLALAVILSQLGRGILQFIRNSSSEFFAQRIERDIRDELYVSLLGKSMKYHDFQPVGELMARVTNDVREVNLMMNPGVNLIVGSAMFILLPLMAAPFIHPALILTPIVFTLLYVPLQYEYVRSLHGVAQEARKSFGHMNASLAETLDGIEVVKGTSQEAQEVASFNASVDSVRNWFVKQSDIEARYLALLLMGGSTVLGFMHSVYLYRAGAIATGDIVAFMGQIALYFFPVFTSIFALSRVASGFASAARILTVISAKTDLDQNARGHEENMQGAIRFEGVDFGYVPERRILHELDFEVKPGQTVAIVGQTGSGKSTITKLINRFYDVEAGKVSIDGVDVRDWNLAALRSQISIIEQEIFLFSRSIHDNIAFGKPGASREEIMSAAQKAQAHDFIMSFPDGYDTVIGQRGVTLSGGQRQRLAIARAFLTDPRILILDDSTSAIDSATEDEIQKAIWAAAKGRTTILITHRLSQIRWADQIIVLKNGRISAQGDHDDLLNSSEAYRRIFATVARQSRTELTLKDLV